MTKKSVCSLLGLALCLWSQPGWGQHSVTQPIPIHAQYAYSVKFVCGASSEEFQEGVVKGYHLTAINIFNPSSQKQAKFVKKVSRGLPYQMSGAMSKFHVDSIAPMHAIEVECNEMRQMLPSPMTAEFRTGFLRILSDQLLDVTAVYTARPRNAEVSSMEVNVIQPKKVTNRPPQSKLPDLTVVNIDVEDLKQECQSVPNSCRTVVPITIKNIGEANATAFKTLVVGDPDQSRSTTEGFAGLVPGESKNFTATLPNGGSCYDPDCTICVTVDVNTEILESNESNNKLCRTGKG